MEKKYDFVRACWRDLMDTLWGDLNRTYSSGIMSTATIAERMRLTESEAEDWLRECIRCGLTERQGGGWVV